jgi:hypothetical protein
MRTLHARFLATALVLGVAAARDAGAQSRWTTLDDFLRRGVGLNAQELAALGRGETVTRSLPTGDSRDVAVFGATQVNIPRSFFTERQRDVARALRTPTRTFVQRFSEPAVTADVQALAVSGDDLKELRDCRPRSCTFKLPATDMDQFRSAVAAGSDARARASAYAGQRMVEYVNDYRARGNAAMLVYHDRGSVRSSDALVGMLRDSTYVFTAVPSLGQHLVDYPRSSLANASEVIFWSLDDMPRLRRVLRITHQTIFAPPERNDLTVVAGKQIYANHYFEAGLEVLAAIDRDATGITVIAVRRYRFDHLPSGGLLNIRGRVASGLRENVLADLRRLKRDGESEWAQRQR